MSITCAIERSSCKARERAPALDARLHGHEEEDGRPDEHDVVDAGLQHLDELEELERLPRGVEGEQGAGEPGHDQREEGGHGRAQGQDRPADPLRPLAGVVADAVQLTADSGQAGFREAVLDTAAELLDRPLDGLRVQAVGHFAVGAGGRCHGQGTTHYPLASVKIKGIRDPG